MFIVKIVIKVKDYKRKMDHQELQNYLQIKRSGSARYKNKKAYDRKRNKIKIG